MDTILKIIIPVLIGTTLTIGGVTVRSEDILASAHVAANQATSHEVKTALELYYLDHGAYPSGDSEVMFRALFEGGYTDKMPLDPDSFAYSVQNDGEDYSLKTL